MINDNELNIKVSITELNLSRIKLSTEIKGAKTIVPSLSEKVIELEDKAIRDGLRALGWMPPENVRECEWTYDKERFVIDRTCGIPYKYDEHTEVDRLMAKFCPDCGGKIIRK